MSIFYLMDLSQTYFSTEITAEKQGELFFIPVGLQLSWRNKKTSLSLPLPACETVTSLGLLGLHEDIFFIHLSIWGTGLSLPSYLS